MTHEIFDRIREALERDYRARMVARDELAEGFSLSTAFVRDGLKPYETAVSHPDYNDGMPIIVEAYDSVDEAKCGHARWVATMKADPLPDMLTDCCNSVMVAPFKGRFCWTYQRMRRQ